MSTDYIPGVCNINPQEIKNRRQIGIIASGASLILLSSLIAFNAPPFVGLIIFVTSFVSATGFLQAANKFCVGYAKAKMQRVGDTDVTIVDADALKQDRAKATKISTQAVVIAFIAAILSIILLAIT